MKYYFPVQNQYQILNNDEYEKHILSFLNNDLLDDLDDCEVFEAEEVLETSELQSIKERINNHTYQILLHYYYQILKEKWRKKKNRSNC